MQINICMAGCCLENYNPKTGCCGVCNFTYDRAAWSRYLTKPYEEVAEKLTAPIRTASPVHVTLSQVELWPEHPKKKPVVIGERNFAWCEKEFPTVRSTAEYCSSACKVAAFRERKRRQENDCPRCDLKNGAKIEHSCAKEKALDHLYSYRQPSRY